MEVRLYTKAPSQLNQYCHQGGLHNGHYYANAKEQKTGAWLEMKYVKLPIYSFPTSYLLLN